MKTRNLCSFIMVLMLTITGCASFNSALPTVVARVQDASLVLDVVKGGVDAYFAQHPDPVVSVKIDKAYVITKKSLIAVLEMGHGAEGLAEGKSAFAAFNAAYTALWDLLVEAGVLAPSTTSNAPRAVALTSGDAPELIWAPTPQEMEARMRLE